MFKLLNMLSNSAETVLTVGVVAVVALIVVWFLCKLADLFGMDRMIFVVMIVGGLAWSSWLWGRNVFDAVTVLSIAAAFAIAVFFAPDTGKERKEKEEAEERAERRAEERMMRMRQTATPPPFPSAAIREGPRHE